ncbi:DUF4339 domain-containing protein [Verrucomicrobiota bacterium sgz303538]
MHYFLWIDGRQRGPYAFDQLQSMWNSGAVSADTFFWHEGMNQGRPIEELLASRAGTTGQQKATRLQGQTAALAATLRTKILSSGVMFRSWSRAFLPTFRATSPAFGGLRALVIAFVVLAVVVLLSADDSPQDTAAGARPAQQVAGPARVPSQEEANQAVGAMVQSILIEHKQELFAKLHWAGEAKTVQVETTSITWKDGRPSANPEDIASVSSVGTLYWSGLVTSNGVTRFRFVFDAENNSGLEILETNGTPKDDLKRAGAKFAGEIITNWLAGQILGGTAQ